MLISETCITCCGIINWIGIKKSTCSFTVRGQGQSTLSAKFVGEHFQYLLILQSMLHSTLDSQNAMLLVFFFCDLEYISQVRVGKIKTDLVFYTHLGSANILSEISCDYTLATMCT